MFRFKCMGEFSPTTYWKQAWQRRAAKVNIVIRVQVLVLTFFNFFLKVYDYARLLLISLHLSLKREGRWGTTDDFTTSFRYDIVACFHHMVSHWQGTTWQSPSLSRSNRWPLSSSWNPSAHLALVLELRRYPPSGAVLTPAISPMTGRLVEGGNVLFLPVQVQKTCPLPTHV